MADSEGRRRAGETPTPEPHPEPRRGEPEGATGGAEAVEKTTYASDARGADVGERQLPHIGVTAAVRSGDGLGPIGWVTLVLALLAFAAYAAGFLTR